MFQKKIVVTFLFMFVCVLCYAQQATISGIVKDEQGVAVDAASIVVLGNNISTLTNAKGYYTLQVPAGKNIAIVATYVGYEAAQKSVLLTAGEYKTWDITLKGQSNTLKEFIKKDDRSTYEAGSVGIDASKTHLMATPIDGVESILKLMVGSNNELTSQYSVRGGSYDENLVYVNDFEIYRPYLVRSGQQEGLSFINPDLVSNVNFSVGGFQPKYGDKMSSVLDVTYKKPTTFSGSVMLSLLGASLHLEGASKNQKLTYLVGARQKSNQYLLQSQPIKGVYNPSFTDLQFLINYRFNSKWEVEAIGNYARNRFTFYPESQVTSFGVINQAYQLQATYTGSELDQFDSYFGGISATYRATDKLKWKFLASAFETHEQETYDKSEEYLIGQIQTDQSKSDFGQIIAAKGTGFIQDYARNFLDVSVVNAGFRGAYSAAHNYYSWGTDVNVTSINDNLHQWEMRDSSNYNQPYNPNALFMNYFFNSAANFNYTRLSGFVQDNFRFSDSSRLSGTIGARYNYSFLNKELVISPRLQLAYQPEWERDVVFRFATGVYAQPPFYREMRDPEGDVNKDLRAQKSYHTVLGLNYNFKKYNRPFKLTVEAYYKYLWDQDPYYYNDVQLVYTGKNDGVGHVYGGELRLYGDIVKDATSWVSIGIMKAEQRLADSVITGIKNGQPVTLYNGGYFPLPNDQRFMLGMYFEDYLPSNKNFKMHLSMLYSTGLPTSPPNGHLFDNTLRLPDYKRVDIGFSALLLDATRREHHSNSFFSNIHNIWASLEVFNLLGIQNTLSYSYIQDLTTGKNFAVPNRLTSRLLNLKIICAF